MYLFSLNYLLFLKYTTYYDFTFQRTTQSNNTCKCVLYRQVNIANSPENDLYYNYLQHIKFYFKLSPFASKIKHILKYFYHMHTHSMQVSIAFEDGKPNIYC